MNRFDVVYDVGPSQTRPLAMLAIETTTLLPIAVPPRVSLVGGPELWR
jgi:hypothetical protein